MKLKGLIILYLFWGIILTSCASIPQKAIQNYQKGQKFLLNGEYTKAISSFQNALKQAPDYVEARMGLAEAYRKSGQLKKAIPEYQKVLNARPRWRKALFGYALSLQKTGQFHHALGIYNNILTYAREDGEKLKKKELHNIYLGFAQCYLGLGNPRQAEKELDKAIQLFPNNPELYYFKGVAKEKQGGLFDEAIQEYQHALKIDPNYALAHRALGYLYFVYYRDDKDWKKKSLHHYQAFLKLAKQKDTNVMAHLKVLEGKEKPAPKETGKEGGKTTSTPPKAKPKKLRCPLCGREYPEGQTKTCFFDGIPLRKVEE